MRYFEFVRNVVGKSRIADGAVISRTPNSYPLANGFRAMPVTEPGLDAIRALVAAMDGAMTLRAERNQVLLGIFPRVTTKLLMMDFQVGHRAARLAAPAITP